MFRIAEERRAVVHEVTNFRFLGTFSKLRKATIGFVLSVCPSVSPSVRIEQLRFQWKDFDET
jgi:hypothetical protein